MITLLASFLVGVAIGIATWVLCSAIASAAADLGTAFVAAQGSREGGGLDAAAERRLGAVEGKADSLLARVEQLGTEMVAGNRRLAGMISVQRRADRQADPVTDPAQTEAAELLAQVHASLQHPPQPAAPVNNGRLRPLHRRT